MKINEFTETEHELILKLQKEKADAETRIVELKKEILYITTQFDGGERAKSLNLAYCKADLIGMEQKLTVIKETLNNLLK